MKSAACALTTIMDGLRSIASSLVFMSITFEYKPNPDKPELKIED
jgi:hypothetical protein